MEQVGVQFIAAGGDVYITTVKNATTATNTFVDATEKGGGRVSGAGQVMIGALRQVGTMAVEAFAQAAKATAAFVGDSIKVAGDFEAGMHKFQAVAGKGVDTKGLEKFKDLFISLGKELPVSTSEVEQAAIEMVSGGIDPAIVAGGALRQTIQFAAASGLSLADAAKTSAKFLAGWTSSAATTAEKVDFLTLSTDVLTKAAAASSTTAAELRLGLFNVQGAAQALHASFSDTTATLALLAPAFESSAQAGTALNVFMTRLVPQTNKAEDAMKALGLITKSGQNVFFDAQGNFLGMGNAAEQLKLKLGSLTDEQKIDTLHQLFGNDAMKVGNLLMQDGAAGLEGMIAKMNEANGVQATAALMQSGYNTALENAKGSVEALQIRIGSFLIPVLTDLLNNWVAPGINAIASFAESFFKMVPAIAASDDPLQTFLNALKIAAPGLFDFIVAIEDIKDAITPTIQEIMRLADALSTGGIGGLIDAVTADITAALPDIEAALMGWAQAFVDWIAPMIPPLIDALIDLANDAWAWVNQQAPIWGAQLQVWGDELVAWIAPMIPPALAELGRLGDQFLGWISDQAEPLLKQLNDWAVSFVAWIPDATVKFLAEWPKMFDDFLNWIGKSAGPLLKQLGDWAVSFTAWILPMIPGFLITLGAIALAMTTWIGETALVLANKVLTTWLPALVDWVVKDAIPKLLKVLGEMWTSFNAWGLQVEHDIGVKMSEVGQSLVDGIKEGISSAWSSFTGWVHSKIMEIPEAVRIALGIGSPSKVMAELVGVPIVQGITQGIQTASPGMLEGVAKIGQQISDSFENTDIIDSLINLGEDAMAGFTKGIKAGIRPVVTYINSTADTIAGAFQEAFGAHSPAELMVPIGESVTQGIMKGIGDMWPSLTDLVSTLGDDLIKQAADIAESVQSAIGDAFGATASIDRQMAKNLESLSKMEDGFYKTATENALRSAADQAKAFADPAVGAKYYKMRSAQIIEFQDLQKRINEETDADTKASLQQQQILILKAQEAEQSAFDATNPRTASPLGDLVTQIGQLFNNSKLEDLQKQLAEAKSDAERARITELIKQAALPVDDTGVGHDLMAMLRQLEIQLGLYTPPPGADGYSPPASPQQMARTATVTNTATTNFNMPIYTNQSPSVVQDSMAIAQAVLP